MAVTGLKLETVSRAFSKLHRAGVIGTNVRDVAILNRNALAAMALNEADGIAPEARRC